MPLGIANWIVARLTRKGKRTADASVLVLGICFNENYLVTRNSEAVDLVNALKNLGAAVNVFDPIVERTSIELKFELLKQPPEGTYEATV